MLSKARSHPPSTCRYNIIEAIINVVRGPSGQRTIGLKAAVYDVLQDLQGDRGPKMHDVGITGERV